MAREDDPNYNGKTVDVRFFGGAGVDAPEVLRGHITQRASAAQTRLLSQTTLSARFLFRQLAPRLRCGQTEICNLMQNKQNQCRGCMKFLLSLGKSQIKLDYRIKYL